LGKFNSESTVELYHQFQGKNGEIYFWDAEVRPYFGLVIARFTLSSALISSLNDH
jgi:hypothetical protein